MRSYDEDLGGEYQSPKLLQALGAGACPQIRSIQYNPVLKRKLNDTIYLCFSDTAEIDGSEINKSIEAVNVAKRQPGERYYNCRGPIIAYVVKGLHLDGPTTRDIDMDDFRHLAHYMRTYGYVLPGEVAPAGSLEPSVPDTRRYAGKLESTPPASASSRPRKRNRAKKNTSDTTLHHISTDSTQEEPIPLWEDVAVSVIKECIGAVAMLILAWLFGIPIYAWRKSALSLLTRMCFLIVRGVVVNIGDRLILADTEDLVAMGHVILHGISTTFAEVIALVTFEELTSVVKYGAFVAVCHCSALVSKRYLHLGRYLEHELAMLLVKT